MGLPADGAEGHRAGGEALHNFFGRFDFLDRYRLPLAEGQQPAKRECPLRLGVDLVAVLGEGFRVILTGGDLEVVDALRVEHVGLPAALPLVDAPNLEFRIRNVLFRKGELVADQHLPGQPIVTDTLDAADASPKAILHHFPVEAQDFKNLCALVRLQRGDADLRHDLQQPLPDRLAVNFDDLFQFVAFLGKDIAGMEVGQGGVGHVGIYRAGPVTDQGSQVVGFPDVAGLHHERGFGA